MVGDEDFSLQLTAVYDLSFENSIFGALHTFLKNNLDPADRVYGVRIISVFGSSSSNRIINGLVQTDMHELLVQILLPLEPVPENDFLFKFCMRALANILSGNMTLIEAFAKKHLDSLVPKIIDFRRFREATYGSMQFLSSLNSDEIIDEVRAIFGKEIVEICIGVLEQKYDEYTVLDVLQILSGATDARKDADEKPFILLNEFLFSMGFFALVTELFEDEHIRDQLKVLALRCLGNALSLDGSPEMDKVGRPHPENPRASPTGRGGHAVHAGLLRAVRHPRGPLGAQQHAPARHRPGNPQPLDHEEVLGENPRAGHEELFHEGACRSLR